MIYSELYLKQKIKLPTIIGVLLVVFITVIFSRLFFGLTGSSKASFKVAKRVEIVNLSASQVSIFWQTEEAELGWVAYGEGKNQESKIALDEKDLNNSGEKKSKY